MEKIQKIPYICGPLTDLPIEDHERIKGFYSRLGDACQEAIGVRAFVPHEHCDPIAFAHLTPTEIDRIERTQVCERTSILIAVYIAPSWGSGIEVEMARQSGVPIIILCPIGKKISRLLSGNPGVKKILYYETATNAIYLIRCNLFTLK